MDVVAEITCALEREVRDLPAGARLPSEHALMGRFGATRSAVRRAIEALERRYLVRRSQGAGTFVNRRIDYVISPERTPSLHETVEAAGSVCRTFVVDMAPHTPPRRVAEMIGTDPDAQLTRIIRVGYIDDEPSTYGEEWLAPGVLDVADVRLRAVESLAAVLRADGREPVRTWARASAEFAPEDVADRFGIAGPVPVWRLETLSSDGHGGSPVLFSRSWQRQDRVRVVVEMGSARVPAG